MDKERVKLKKYLEANAGILSIRNIERDAGLSEGTVRRFISGERGLSDHAKEKLIPVLEKLGYNKSKNCSQ